MCVILQTSGMDMGALLMAVDESDKHVLSVWDWQHNHQLAKTHVSPKIWHDMGRFKQTSLHIAWCHNVTHLQQKIFICNCFMHYNIDFFCLTKAKLYRLYSQEIK